MLVLPAGSGMMFFILIDINQYIKPGPLHGAD